MATTICAWPFELGSRPPWPLTMPGCFEELRANDRRKDEFLAMLAHELRNPLAASTTLSRLLGVSDSGHDNIDWSVEVIGRHVRHLTRLIDDLLDVSRITRGKIQLRTNADRCLSCSASVRSSRSAR